MSRNEVLRDEFNTNLCHLVRQLADEHKLTQLDVANATGLTRRHISRIMCAQRAVTVSELILLADALNTTTTEMIFRARNPEDYEQT